MILPVISVTEHTQVWHCGGSVFAWEWFAAWPELDAHYHMVRFWHGKKT